MASLLLAGRHRLRNCSHFRLGLGSGQPVRAPASGKQHRQQHEWDRPLHDPRIARLIDMRGLTREPADVRRQPQPGPGDRTPERRRKPRDRPDVRNRAVSQRATNNTLGFGMRFAMNSLVRAEGRRRAPRAKSERRTRLLGSSQGGIHERTCRSPSGPVRTGGYAGKRSTSRSHAVSPVTRSLQRNSTR
jgi:hypothetical protein